MSVLYELKQAWRTLRKKPGFVFAVVSTLGVALGALLCVITLANLLLREPLPYPDSENLYRIDATPVNGYRDNMFPAHSYPSVMYIAENQRAFSELALVYYGLRALNTSPDHPTINVSYVTPAWFSIMDAPMALGRAFNSSEMRGSNNAVAIISYKAWKKLFQLRQDILNEDIVVGGESFRVVGVAAPDFYEPQIYRTGRDTDVWLPWDFVQQKFSHTIWSYVSTELHVYGKLKKHLSQEEGRKHISDLINPVWAEKLKDNELLSGSRLDIALHSFDVSLLGASRTTAYMLLLGFLGLVLIACVNISNLFIARASERQRELAISAAVGARKSHIFQTLYIEALLLMIFAIILAFIVAKAGIYLLQSYIDDVLPRVSELEFNFVTFVSAGLIVIGLAYLFAKISSHTISYKSLNLCLQSGGKGVGLQVSKTIRRLLIVIQVALGAILVFANIALLVGALESIVKPLGIDIEDRVNIELFSYSDTGLSMQEFVPISEDIRKKLLALPEIEAVSQSGPPHYGFRHFLYEFVSKKTHSLIAGNIVDERYFPLLNQQFIEGRNYTEADMSEGRHVLIVNEAFARRIRSEGSVLGETVKMGGNPFTVIGVVENIPIPGEHKVEPLSYLPAWDKPECMMMNNKFLVKLTPGAKLSRTKVVSVLADVSEHVTLFLDEPLKVGKHNMLTADIVTAFTTAALAVLVFFLAAIGVYGVVSYGVQLRRFELGTRMAVGAKRRHIFTLVVKDSFTAVAMGLVVGVVLMVVLSLLFGAVLGVFFKANTVMHLLITLLLISMVSLFACYWPLRYYFRTPALMILRK